MKYFSTQTIFTSIELLSNIDLFYLTTFLVMKREKIPVGGSMYIPITVLDREFMDINFRIITQSKYYFRLSKTSNSEKFWLDPKYPEGGLQRTRTQKFTNAFIHEKRTSEWGWREDYLDTLLHFLTEGIKINSLALAVWLYKYEPIPEYMDSHGIISRFYDEFNINSRERENIFEDELFEVRYSEKPVEWIDFAEKYPLPPDVDSGANYNNLQYISANGVGNIQGIEIIPGSRLNMLYGENSSGKTLLLDVIYWTFTSHWPNEPILPNSKSSKDSWIRWTVSDGHVNSTISIVPTQNDRGVFWQSNFKSPKFSRKIIYFKSDGSVSIYSTDENINLSQNEIFNGQRSSKGFSKIETIFTGLYFDMDEWTTIDVGWLERFNSILEHLSPIERHGKFYRRNRLQIGFNDRNGVVVKTKYGEIPVNLLSSGLRRIISMAYIVTKEVDESGAIILFDEIENHLHPAWQRTIMTAVLDTLNENVQVFCTSHSSIIVGSIENMYNAEIDKLYVLKPNSFIFDNLEMRMTAEEMDFAKQGSYTGWLTSDALGLASDRPIETEEAINEAEQLQSMENPPIDRIKVVGTKLRNYLPSYDEFWPLWLYFERKFVGEDDKN